MLLDSDLVSRFFVGSSVVDLMIRVKVGGKIVGVGDISWFGGRRVYRRFL